MLCNARLEFDVVCRLEVETYTTICFLLSSLFVMNFRVRTVTGWSAFAELDMIAIVNNEYRAECRQYWSSRCTRCRRLEFGCAAEVSAKNEVAEAH